MNRERILVTVKTYPTLSRKYGELVCTAGFRENGSWIRLYPVPFRLKDFEERYKKWDWLETELVKSGSDNRPESFHPKDHGDMPIIGHIETTENWRERRKIVLQKGAVHYDLSELIDTAHDNLLSLATFKPLKILNFEWEKAERKWDEKKIHEMRNLQAQGMLFEEENWRESFKLIPKLPYKFFYKFEDIRGKISRMQIIDWEIGQLYWNCLRGSESEEMALGKVEEKYNGEFSKKDIHFFLGTTKQFHLWGNNPFLIIGVFPIPYENQLDLF